jgi:hypothetical protein
LTGIGGFAVRDAGQITAFNTDGVQFGDKVGYGQ